MTPPRCWGESPENTYRGPGSLKPPERKKKKKDHRRARNSQVDYSKKRSIPETRSAASRSVGEKGSPAKKKTFYQYRGPEQAAKGDTDRHRGKNKTPRARTRGQRKRQTCAGKKKKKPRKKNSSPRASDLSPAKEDAKKNGRQQGKARNQQQPGPEETSR